MAELSPGTTFPTKFKYWGIGSGKFPNDQNVMKFWHLGWRKVAPNRETGPKPKNIKRRKALKRRKAQEGPVRMLSPIGVCSNHSHCTGARWPPFQEAKLLARTGARARTVLHTYTRVRFKNKKHMTLWSLITFL